MLIAAGFHFRIGWKGIEGKPPKGLGSMKRASNKQGDIIADLWSHKQGAKQIAAPRFSDIIKRPQSSLTQRLLFARPVQLHLSETNTAHALVLRHRLHLNPQCGQQSAFRHTAGPFDHLEEVNTSYPVGCAVDTYPFAAETRE